MIKSFFAALYAVCVFPAIAAPPEKLPPVELPVPPAIFKETKQSAYGIYLNGAKAGWGSIAFGPGKIGDKDAVDYTNRATIEMKSFGKIMRVEMSERKQFDIAPPHRALLLELQQKMDGQERRVTLRHKDGTSYSVEVTEAGKKRASDDITLDLRLTHAVSPEVWVSDPQRKAGDATGALEFDFESLKLEMETATILKAAEWTGPGGKIPVWELDIYNHAKRLGIKASMSRTDGTMVNGAMGEVFEMRMEPEAVAKQKPGEQADVFLAMAIKADRKLGRSGGLGALQLELVGKPGGPALELPETVNQTVKKNASGSVTLTITRGGGKKQPATDKDREENLKATLRYPSTHEAVKALAATAIGSAKDDTEKVKSLLRFTDLYLRDSYEVEALSVMDLLKSRKGECSAHALLFTALARAAGIPAREAGGWMYMGDSYQSFGGHAWNEVVLDGHWVPVDAIYQQFQLDAGHIQQVSGENNESMVGFMAGGMQAKIISSGKE